MENVNRYRQVASAGHWLYTPSLESDECQFGHVALIDEGQPLMQECTDAEHDEWVEKHTPEQPQPQETQQ